MFFMKKKPSDTEMMIKELQESKYKMELASRDRKISMLETELEMKNFLLAAKDLCGVILYYGKDER